MKHRSTAPADDALVAGLSSRKSYSSFLLHRRRGQRDGGQIPKRATSNEALK
jgi:hypothetical protein